MCFGPPVSVLILFPLTVSASDSQSFGEEPLKKEILYKCVLYPSTLLFPSIFSPSFPLFLFVITRPTAQLSRWYPYLCVPFAKAPPSCPLLHPRSRSVVFKVDIPIFLSRTLSPSGPSYPLSVEIFMLDASRVWFAVIFETIWRIHLG